MTAAAPADATVVDAFPDRLTRYPVAHLIGCPVEGNMALALEWVEHYADRYRTSRARDVDDQSNLGRRVMVAHCTKCGGMSYHDV